MSSREPNPRPLHVAFAVFPGMTLLDLVGPLEVLARVPGAQVGLVPLGAAGSHGEWVVTDLGFNLGAAPKAVEGEPVDLFLVPGGPGQVDLMECRESLLTVQLWASKAQVVASVCTGSLVLAAAGLLTGYRATTHWLSLGLLKLLGAQPVADRVVFDRDRLTGAGVSAGLDLALVAVAHFCGNTVAQEIQLLLEYDPQPPWTAGSPATADPQVIERVSRARRDFQDQRLRQVERIASWPERRQE